MFYSIIKCVKVFIAMYILVLYNTDCQRHSADIASQLSSLKQIC